MNNNLAVVDTAVDGSLSITLPTTQTTQGAPYSLGATQVSRVVSFTGPQSATGYIQIDPPTAQRVYFARNQTSDSLGGAAHPLIFQQANSGHQGTTVSVAPGYDAILFADGAGAGTTPGNVAAIQNPQFNNVLITGTLTVTGSQAQASISLDTTNVVDTTRIRRIFYTTSGSPRWEIQATTGPSETDPNNPASDLKVLAYDTSGNLIANGSVLYISRASGNVVIGPGANMPARLTILASTQSGAADQVILNVVGRASQLYDIFQVQTFNGTSYTTLFGVDSAGFLHVQNQTGINWSGSVGGVTMTFVGGILVAA